MVALLPEKLECTTTTVPSTVHHVGLYTLYSGPTVYASVVHLCINYGAILVYKRKSGVRDQKQWALGEKEAHRNEEMEKEERERGEEEYHCQLHVGS